MGKAARAFVVKGQAAIGGGRRLQETSPAEFRNALMRVAVILTISRVIPAEKEPLQLTKSEFQQVIDSREENVLDAEE